MISSEKFQSYLLATLCLLCAGNGFLVEANITQSLSAAYGGTIFQYQLGLGLFVFSLGIGSLSYSHFAAKWSHRQILTLSTLGLLLMNLVGPSLSYLLSEWGQLTLGHPLSWIAYLPLIAVGLVTGLDLPVLIFCSLKGNLLSEQKVLGLDYLGMFAACVLFPFLFQGLGVFSLMGVSVVLSICTLLGLSQLNAPKKQTESAEPLQWTLSSIMLLSFLLSFCSLAYELLLARWLVDFIENEVFAMTYAIGCYLVGLGVGSYRAKAKDWGPQLLRLEFILIFTVLLIPLFGYFCATAWQVYFRTPFSLNLMQAVFLLIISGVGFLSGHELPYLMQAVKSNSSTQWPQLFFWNYVGALVASLSVSLFLLPSFGLLASLLIVSTVNIVALFVLKRAATVKRPLFLGGLLVLSLMIIWSPRQTVQWEQMFLKVYYNNIFLPRLSMDSIKSLFRYEKKTSPIRRLVTPYQNIDLVRTELPMIGTGMDDLHLYLNRQPQFSLYFHNLYHDSFSYGAINLAQQVPGKVLILGGGDGLLAHKLFQINGIESVTLVELDQQMVELAQEHLRLQQANGGVFDRDDLQLVFQDAYSWVKSTSETFDAIFVDFPYPINYELSRLFSKEFYTRVAKVLRPEGFLVMNAPISFGFDEDVPALLESTGTLINTLKVSGFQSVLPFGVKEPFIYGEKRSRELAFDYSKLPADFPNASFVNLSPINEVIEMPPVHKVNSVYKPEKVVSW